MARRITPTAQPFVPDSRSLRVLRAASQECRGCDLYKRATQTVFGSGAARARVLLLGEQPGDKEDLAGEPFVGPAGALLSRALADAGLVRKTVFVTNAVKHFKWEPRGKRRIHKKPSALEITACRPWLNAEIESVRPEIVVCLGATAAQSLLGRDFRVTQRRGELIASSIVPQIVATVHPSSILRAPDDETRRREYSRFVEDLKKVAQALRRLPKAA